MAQRKTAATPVRQHWSYLSSAASHQYEHGNMTTDLNRPICVLITTAEHKTAVTSECQHQLWVTLLSVKYKCLVCPPEHFDSLKFFHNMHLPCYTKAEKMGTFSKAKLGMSATIWIVLTHVLTNFQINDLCNRNDTIKGTNVLIFYNQGPTVPISLKFLQNVATECGRCLGSIRGEWGHSHPVYYQLMTYTYLSSLGCFIV